MNKQVHKRDSQIIGESDLLNTWLYVVATRLTLKDCIGITLETDWWENLMVGTQWGRGDSAIESIDLAKIEAFTEQITKMDLCYASWAAHSETLSWKRVVATHQHELAFKNWFNPIKLMKLLKFNRFLILWIGNWKYKNASTFFPLVLLDNQWNFICTNKTKYVGLEFGWLEYWVMENARTTN